MAPIIQEHLDALIELCRKYRVQSLYLFGSAANGEFRPGESDLDFLITFEPLTPREHCDAYFGLADALQKLFGTEIDLVEEKPIRNPYLRRELEKTRVMLYAA